MEITQNEVDAWNETQGDEQTIKTYSRMLKNDIVAVAFHDGWTAREELEQENTRCRQY